MFVNLKITIFKVLTLTYCLFGSFPIDGASGENVLSYNSIISLPYEANKLLHREKRQGGGGIIPFRPLFVYRAQQREQQEKWREIEARKKLKQQSLQYQQYQDTIKSNEQIYQRHPSTPYKTYSNPSTQYSSNNYPSPYYSSSYSYPSYYGRYEYDKDAVYRKELSNYYQNYYDGYEYSYF